MVCVSHNVFTAFILAAGYYSNLSWVANARVSHADESAYKFRNPIIKRLHLRSSRVMNHYHHLMDERVQVNLRSNTHSPMKSTSIRKMVTQDFLRETAEVVQAEPPVVAEQPGSVATRSPENGEGCPVNLYEEAEPDTINYETVVELDSAVADGMAASVVPGARRQLNNLITGKIYDTSGKRAEITGYRIISEERVEEYCNTMNQETLQSMWLKDYAKFYKKMPMRGLQQVVDEFYKALGVEEKDESGKVVQTSIGKEMQLNMLDYLQKNISSDVRGAADRPLIDEIHEYMDCIARSIATGEDCTVVLNNLGWIELFKNTLASKGVAETGASAGSSSAISAVTNIVLDGMLQTLSDPIAGAAGAVLSVIADLIVHKLLKEDNRAATIAFFASKGVGLVAAVGTAAIIASITGVGAAAVGCVGLSLLAGLVIKEAFIMPLVRNLPAFLQETSNVVSLYFGQGIDRDVCVMSFGAKDGFQLSHSEQLKYKGTVSVDHKGDDASISSGDLWSAPEQIGFYLNHCNWSPQPRDDPHTVIAKFGKVYREDALILCPLKSLASLPDADNFDIIWARGSLNQNYPGGINRIDTNTLKRLKGQILNKPSPLDDPQTMNLLKEIDDEVERIQMQRQGAQSFEN